MKGFGRFPCSAAARSRSKSKLRGIDLQKTQRGSNMEYRRRRTAAKRRDRSGSGALRALVLVLMFGAAAYLLLGTGVGKKLKEGYALSLIGSCIGENAPENSGRPDTGTPLPLLTTPEPSASPAPAAEGSSAEVSLPGIEIHMLQLGIYSSEEEMGGLAQQIRVRGGAGYVYNDGGSLRLIISSYSDAAQAESVKQSLALEGVECSVFTVSREGVELLVTADEARLVPIRTAFFAAFDAVTQLDELALDYDANSRSIGYALGVLSEIDANCAAASAGIEPSVKDNAMLSLLTA